MRLSAFARLLVMAPLALVALVACSSDEGGPSAPGTLSLESVSSEHDTSIIRFSATLKNGTAKAIKTLDTMELDPGSGPKRFTLIQPCAAGDGAPWLAKAGASATVSFTVRNNGPERMVVDGKCASSESALWESLTKIETNASGPLKIAMNGTYEDGAIWSITATSTRK
jgi:hypothetical protein